MSTPKVCAALVMAGAMTTAFALAAQSAPGGGMPGPGPGGGIPSVGSGSGLVGNFQAGGLPSQTPEAKSYELVTKYHDPATGTVRVETQRLQIVRDTLGHIDPRTGEYHSWRETQKPEAMVFRYQDQGSGKIHPVTVDDAGNDDATTKPNKQDNTPPTTPPDINKETLPTDAGGGGGGDGQIKGNYGNLGKDPLPTANEPNSPPEKLKMCPNGQPAPANGAC